MTESPLLPVVLCGGSGTRLWPLSRGDHPKQFHSLLSSSSLLQDTLGRMEHMDEARCAIAPAILVCNVEHRFLVASQLQQMGVSDAKILLEPQGRNTAPALTIAALLTYSSGLDPVLVVMPADHAIADTTAFHTALATAYQSALLGSLVVLGVPPTRPETGYGYIHCGAANTTGTLQVASFVEKPDAERAEQFLAAGNYLWNSGIFVMKASVWLKALQNCRPDIYEACSQSMQKAVSDLDFVRPDLEAFNSSPSDSIDYAVMERLPGRPDLGIRAEVVPLDAGWSDVGAWDALWKVHAKDDAGNALIGETLQQGCEDSLLLSSSRLVSGVGLKDIAVVETADAVLVVDMQKTQDVKLLTARLSSMASGIVRTHRKVHRPWGWYDSIDQGPRFKVKRLVVNPGARLSLQMHNHRAEHWVVVKGVAEVTKGEQVFSLCENESVYIPVREVHRLRNPGEKPLEIVEVQTGDYLEEDDIVRLSSDY